MQDWGEFWAATSVLSVVGWILGIIGIIAFLTKSWPVVVRFVHFFEALFSLPAFIKRTDATLAQQNLKIAEIHHETHNNDGSSIKDGVDRIELGQHGLYRVVATLAASHSPELAAELADTQPEALRRPRVRKTP